MTVAYGWGSELQGHVDDEGDVMLDRVLRTVQHTSDLTDTLHDIVDGFEPGSDPVVEPTPLRSHLRDQLDSCRETFPEATFTTDEIPDVAVRANPLLGSVFQNILSNAVRHNDSDDPSVVVTTRRSGDRIQVRIADDGPGVRDERKAAIFGRGKKGLESPGSGLGLYLVDTIVDHYDGDVWIEDNDPRGAVFVVDLHLAN